MNREALVRAISDPGYTPKRRDAKELLTLLDEKDESIAQLAEKALLRVDDLDDAAKDAFSTAAPRARGRICRLLAKHGAAPRLATWLSGVLADDADAGVRKRAARALGQAKSADVEAALLDAWEREKDLPALRAIAESLGKVGTPSASEALAAKSIDDPELERIVKRARLIIDRTDIRVTAIKAIDPNRAPSRPLAMRFRCRAGLAPIVASELDKSFSPRIVSPGAVDATLAHPISACFASRCAMDFGFVVEPELVTGDDVNAAVVRALAKARRIFSELEPAPHRFRLSFTGGGHRRGAVWKIADDVRKVSADLVNDPTESTWEVVVRERAQAGKTNVELLLIPSALEDSRFAYRVRDVPAASHPTIAAALARIGGVREDDVVWDPFVGSGSELIERAKLGKYARLIGSDIDDNALEAAAENAKAAGVDIELVNGDALKYSPGKVSLIISNPPLGRRLNRDSDLRVLFDRFLSHAASLLTEDGRIVWVSPLAERTSEQAKKLGLTQDRGIDVDMGGFSGQIQLFSRSSKTKKAKNGR
ncbi:MAG: methyltransferase [Polyangiaceae bacterium]